MAYWGYPRYVSVADKKAKAEKKLKQLMKKNPDMKPVIIEGTAIARTWWGKSWNKNLERYADYSNRIGRGRSYVRHRAVLDLQIAAGSIEGLVMGSSSRPYSVKIGIKPVAANTWKEMVRACEGKMQSLQKLLTGKIPKALQEVFMAKGKGLFPKPSEITLSCSCPDAAVMCKHVAAVLYGVGARLDKDPNLFFELRKANVNDLVSQAVQDQTGNLLKKAKKKSSRVMADDNLSDVFGIDLGEEMDALPPLKKTGKKAAGMKKTVPKAKKNPRSRKAASKTEPGTKKISPKKGKKAAPASLKKAEVKKQEKKPGRTKPASAGKTASEKGQLEALIQKSKKGIAIPELVKKTGFQSQKINNLIYRLKKEGRIKNVSRGVYISA